MNGYPLQELLRIRELRERNAEVEVKRCKKRLEDAVAALKKRQAELADYTTWRIGEEERLFMEILEKFISLAEVEKYKQSILSLRGREVQYQERIIEAEQHIAQCNEALDAAREARLTAMKERMKIDEHRARWQEDESILAERAEELELEEFTGTHNSIFDDDEAGAQNDEQIL